MVGQPADDKAAMGAHQQAVAPALRLSLCRAGGPSAVEDGDEGQGQQEAQDGGGQGHHHITVLYAQGAMKRRR